MSSTRVGKIASLPAEIREELNQRLLDGQQGPQILPWLNQLPAVITVLNDRFEGAEISAQNLSEWRLGGYKEWRERREKIEDLKVLSSYALRLGQAAGASLTDGSAAIAGGKILTLIENAEGEDLDKLIDALAKVRSGDLEAVRARQRERLLEQKERNLEQNERKLALEETKFRRQTAELFLTWYNERRAREIADSKDAKDVKMDQLVLLMFGEKPKELA